MATLFIRNRHSYITFLRSKEEFQAFSEYFIPGRHLTIGDIATFNRPMRNMLLKFIEEHPEVDCYSSEDLVDTVIQSRFVKIVKDPLEYTQTTDTDAFRDSDKSYMATLLFLSLLSNQAKLRVPKTSGQVLKLLL